MWTPMISEPASTAGSKTSWSLKDQLCLEQKKGTLLFYWEGILQFNVSAEQEREDLKDY